ETSFGQTSIRVARRSRPSLASGSGRCPCDLLPGCAAVCSGAAFFLGGHEPQRIRVADAGGRSAGPGSDVCVDEGVAAGFCAPTSRVGFQPAGTFNDVSALDPNPVFAVRAATVWSVPVAAGAAGPFAVWLDLRIFPEYHGFG